MKWGSAYGPRDVNTLRAMVGRHLALPHRFVCFTDDGAGLDPSIEVQPMPRIEVPVERQISPWRKIGLFTPGLGGLTGRTLFLDLDVVIVGAIDPLVTWTDKVGIAENWTQPGAGVGNSSVFTYDIDKYAFVLDTYNATRGTLFDTYPNSQTFMSRTLGPENIDFFPPDWVVSFKHSCMPGGLRSWFETPRLPAGARVVAFHGNPKPQHAIEGRYPGKWYKHVRRTPWVAEHWR
ncbi:MAG: hypothetical protein HXY25_12125 [Alphaproteobacteria bacterium]|nr:hypothetical protein [Alphaproteobacteria bacterium]